MKDMKAILKNEKVIIEAEAVEQDRNKTAYAIIAAVSILLIYEHTQHIL